MNILLSSPSSARRSTGSDGGGTIRDIQCDNDHNWTVEGVALPPTEGARDGRRPARRPHTLRRAVPRLGRGALQAYGGDGGLRRLQTAAVSQAGGPGDGRPDPPRRTD